MSGRRFCINWKVVGALAAVGLGIWVYAPGVMSAALPFLLLAACPLSMLFMMRSMQGGGGSSTATKDPAEAVDQVGAGDRLAQLKAQLAQTRAQQDAVAAEVVRLESSALTSEAEAALSEGDAHAPEEQQALPPASERTERQ